MINSNNLRISLDRKEPDSDIDFISHAHTDHLAAAKKSKMVLASQQTIDLIEQSQGIKVNCGEVGKDFRLIEAGHMLGSKQLCVNDNVTGKRITYTGDFQTVQSRTSKPIEVAQTDILIMDSTYEDPRIRFEDKNQVELSIQEWTSRKLNDGIVIFSAYAMGKAQELISVFNEAGIRPVVSKKIDMISRVYKNNGIRLDYSSQYDESSDWKEALRGNFVGISETRNLQGLRSCLHEIHGKRVFTAVATGWAKCFRFDTDAQFSFSDHADFMQSVDYIDATGAKEVLTYGSSAEHFAQNLRYIGYNATSFSNSHFSLNYSNCNK